MIVKMGLKGMLVKPGGGLFFTDDEGFGTIPLYLRQLLEADYFLAPRRRALIRWALDITGRNVHI